MLETTEKPFEVDLSYRIEDMICSESYLPCKVCVNRRNGTVRIEVPSLIEDGRKFGSFIYWFLSDFCDGERIGIGCLAEIFILNVLNSLNSELLFIPASRELDRDSKDRGIDIVVGIRDRTNPDYIHPLFAIDVTLMDPYTNDRKNHGINKRLNVPVIVLSLSHLYVFFINRCISFVEYLRYLGVDILNRDYDPTDPLRLITQRKGFINKIVSRLINSIKEYSHILDEVNDMPREEILSYLKLLRRSRTYLYEFLR